MNTLPRTSRLHVVQWNIMYTVKTDWLKQPIFIGCNQFLIGHFNQLHNWSLRNDQLKLVTSTN